MRFVLGVDKAFERKIRPILQQKPFGVYPQLICSPVGQAKAITWVYNPKKVVK